MLHNSHNLILVVEDDEVCRRLVVRQLTHLGFTVHCAANGKEAIERVSRTPYCLILMDIQMPEMGGVEATTAIRQLEQTTGRQHVPIIALSANPEDDSYQKSGLDGFLFKPCSLDQLRNVLSHWLAA